MPLHIGLQHNRAILKREVLNAYFAAGLLNPDGVSPAIGPVVFSANAFHALKVVVGKHVFHRCRFSFGLLHMADR